MKFAPRYNQIIGRLVIKRVLTKILRPDETKDTTKFVLVDAVGPGAKAAGILVGCLVVPRAITTIVLDGGVSRRPSLEEKDAMFFVTDVIVEELAVQTDDGTKFVPLASEEAAVPLGAQLRAESEAA